MIINCTGGAGSSGLTLSVQALAAGTITVSNTSLGKSYSKEVAAGGTAVFGGLAPAAWTVTLSDGSQSTTISVTLESNKFITIAYFSATIVATYPAGSTCTCSDGTNTLTAPDTSGSATFTVPNAGTWTVSCTDGTNSKSQNVEITTEGQSEPVVLSYAWYLFTSGLGLTSGYTVERTRSGDSFVQNTSYIGADDSDMGAIFYFTPKIDLSPYKTLMFDIKCSGQYGDEYVLHLGVGSNGTANNDENPTSDVARTSVYSTTRKTVSVDVSDLTASYYVKVHGGAVAFNIYNIWLD